MNWSTLILLIFFLIIILACYLLLNLNTIVVSLDLLFFELEVNLGLILLVSFLTGSFITIFLEIIFFRRRVKEDE